MKTIIAGSRSITDYETVKRAIELSGFVITEEVSGGAPGVDTLGEQWAEDSGIPVTRFLPDWQTFGKKAGIIRNTNMASYAEALVAAHDGVSRGTAHMITVARAMKLKVFVYPVNMAEPPASKS